MLGYRHLQRQAGLGAVHRDGLPVGAIVEELHMLGVKRILGIGTCGGLQPDLKLGDLIVAVSAVPQDATAVHYLAGESHTDRRLEARARRRSRGERARQARARRSDRLERHLLRPRQGAGPALVRPGILAVEMEAAVLFTLGALRGFKAGCLLTVSDVVVEGEFVRISDEEMKAASTR